MSGLANQRRLLQPAALTILGVLSTHRYLVVIIILLGGPGLFPQLLPAGDDERQQSPAAEEAPAALEGMVFIPGGWFEMGSLDGNEDEQPVHRVYIDAFYIDRHEVTVARYAEFCSLTGKTFPGQPAWSDENHPVVNVTWVDAAAYAGWIGKRLPTEAEWEYVARCGRRGYRYAWGDGQPVARKGGNIADEAAGRVNKHWTIWKGYDDGYVYSAPVASFAPNEWGVFDMTGNVWEWCVDWYQKDYYARSPFYNPRGPKSGERKVLRGGSWSNQPLRIRTANRVKATPGRSDTNIGFRCARGVTAKRANHR